MRDRILYFVFKYFGDWERVYDAIQDQEEVDLESLKNINSGLEEDYITILDEEYPEKLKLIDKPPFVLFLRGDKSLLKDLDKYWYFGSYQTKWYLKIANAHKIQLENLGCSIITGYTDTFERKLVDSLQLRKSIIIKDSGIDSFSNIDEEKQKRLADENLIVSEYPGNSTPSLHSWKMSNRIKAGLSKGMIIPNSSSKGYLMDALKETLNQKLNVYCFHHDNDKESKNSSLILNGATKFDNINKKF